MIRFRSLELEGFKNVGQGRVVLSNVTSIDDIGGGADIVGLYGQNGSGKTSFVQALSVIKYLMSGETLDSKFKEYISSERGFMDIKVEFFVAYGDDDALSDYILGIVDAVPEHTPYIGTYAVRIGSYLGRAPLVLSESLSCKNISAGESMHVVFSWELADGGRGGEPPLTSVPGMSDALTKIVDSASEEWSFDLGQIAPASRWQAFLGTGNALSSRFEAMRSQSFREGSSLLFSSGFMAIAAECLSRDGAKATKGSRDAIARVLRPSLNISATCRYFATKNMVVLPTAHQGVLPLRFLPLASHEGEHGDYADNFIFLDIDSEIEMDSKMVEEIERTLENVNDVIGEIVPGLKVTVKRLGRIVGSNGETLERIGLLSVRGDVAVPLRNESEGIQKLLSIVSLLIDVHSNPATLVGIDEFDSGVFEYLLGEILQALSEHGYGQLVFTAHNLRPLEVLPSSSICFTTAEPDNRYVRARGVRGSNNLRSMYLRTIRLGSDEEDMYVSTSPLRIDGALYEAGARVREMLRKTRD